MITFDKIRVTYGDFVALPGLDLTIGAGEFFTLLGPSGCGKSTALRTLAGFISPQSGTITINGRNITNAPSHRRGVGMVFQNYALFPSMDVWDNLAFGLKTAKVGRAQIKERVRDVAARVDLRENQLSKSVTELSGGQQQRVAIARALVMKPEILLLDEPLSNLDAKLRQQLRIQLKELQREFGITTLYVTHDQEEALSMSDRLAVLNEGRIEQVGAPAELYDHSASEFVCTFLGDVNRLSAGQVTELNRQGADLAESDRHFVRGEKIRTRRADEPGGAAGLCLAGRVAARHYHGTASTFDVECVDRSIRVLLQETGAVAIAPGDEVHLEVERRHLLSYAPAATPEAPEAAP